LKNLESVIAENAQGILASTMKEEIKELVKESLTEQEDEIETDVDMDVETPADDLMMADDDTEMDTDNLDTDIDMDDTIDLTGEDTESIMKVFKLMGPEDSITVVKDEAGNINLKDEDKEYMLVGESEEEEESMEEYYDEEMEMDESDDEEMEMDDSDDEEMEMDESDDVDDIVNKVFGEQRFDDEDEDEDEMFEGEEDDEEDMDEDSHLEESKITSKPKGKGFGSASKFKFAKKPNMAGGFKEKMKEGPKSVGTGKAKFEYKEGENLGKKLGKNTVVKAGTKKVETKEASRTLGSGSKFRKGGLPKPRAHSQFNTAIEESTSQKEVQILREKNEEYRKALNVFRNKLNEVAVFNSNLAYATRLFTEHSTSKQEKINILRRFDSVENIKESKNLYKTIKDELSSTSTQVQTVTESVEKRIEKSPSSGSAANLIESKTYENPQFLRMKDLMSKLK
jgi:hypothetical protein